MVVAERTQVTHLWNPVVAPLPAGISTGACDGRVIEADELLESSKEARLMFDGLAPRSDLSSEPEKV